MLLECLQSVVAQELEDWEAIVVDDGTPTAEVSECVKNLLDDRIRYVRHVRNLGLGAARNTGFRAARADVVLPIDSDDTLDPSFLRVTLAALQEDSTADFVFTDFQLFGDSDRVRHQRVRSLRELLQADWIPGPGTLQRKSVWERVGGYCELPTMTAEEDWDYWIGACERGLVAKHIPMPLYRYRQHGDSMTAKVWSSEFQLRELIYARHKRTFDDHGLGSAFRAAGYLESSIGYLRAGRRVRSVRLALHAVGLEPRNTQLWRHLAVTLLPATFVAKRRERRLRDARAAERPWQPHPTWPLGPAMRRDRPGCDHRLLTVRRTDRAQSPRRRRRSEKVLPKSDPGTIRGRLRIYRFLLSSDVVFVIGGRRRLGRHERVLIRCGLPMVIYWLGTDVLEWSVGDEDIVRCVWNRAVAPWLVDELEAEGLPGVELAPWACEDMPDDIPGFPQPFTVVAYTPQDRLDFYGIAFIVELARRLGDVRFELLATTLKDGLPPNVRTLGWVEDMDAVMRRATVLVRPVMHDGLANMVLEALAYGRYVLWSYEMPGVERITTLDAAEKYIRELAEQSLTGYASARTSWVEQRSRRSTTRR